MNYSMKEFGIDKINTKYYGGKFFKGIGKILSLPFGGPFLTKGLSLGASGIASTIRGVKWVGNTAKEGALGFKDMTLKPAYRIGTAAIDDIKRTRFWDVPKASLSAMFKSPAALLMSPINLVKGVRASIASIPGNTKELWNNLTAFKVVDTMRSTRNLVWDVLKNPFTHTIGPIIKPPAKIAEEIAEAKWQYVEGTRQAIDDAVGGWERIKNAPAVATEKMEIEREFEKQIAERKKEIKKEELDKDLQEAGIVTKPKIEEDSNIIDINTKRKEAEDGVSMFSKAA